jgi:hypothetical protein
MKINIKLALEALENLKAFNRKEIDELIKNRQKVNWRKYANLEEKLLKSYFSEIRQEFLNKYNKLEAGKLDYELSKSNDSISPSNYAHVESWILHGWKYENGKLCNGEYSRNLNKSMAKYAEYLTNIIFQLV